MGTVSARHILHPQQPEPSSSFIEKRTVEILLVIFSINVSESTPIPTLFLATPEEGEHFPQKPSHPWCLLTPASLPSAGNSAQQSFLHICTSRIFILPFLYTGYLYIYLDMLKYFLPDSHLSCYYLGNLRNLSCLFCAFSGGWYLRPVPKYDFFPYIVWSQSTDQVYCVA